MQKSTGFAGANGGQLRRGELNAIDKPAAAFTGIRVSQTDTREGIFRALLSRVYDLYGSDFLLSAGVSSAEADLHIRL